MYAYSMDVPMTLEAYDKVHADLESRFGGLAEGCLMHLVVATEGGFRVTDVWESHEAADRYGEVMRPTLERVLGPQAVAGPPPATEELRVHNLELPRRAAAPA
jgi:hypothetical protein